MSLPRSHAETRSRSRRRASGWLINAILALCVISGVQWYKARPLVRGDAPGLRETLTSGQPFDVADWRGEPVLIHFWAKWCPICRAEEGGIDTLADDHNVITIAMQSGEDPEINAYLLERGLSFDAIADPDGEIAAHWGVRAVPASFVLDGDGRIRFASVGYSPGFGLRGKLWLARYLD
ncbi:MAG: protein disulfide oxidoreductase [Thiohalocapsa sp.]|jgi:thiol-disulfide isomerase/thioredoxin